MARAALAIAFLTAGCGLVSRDYTVQAIIVAGGGSPGSNPQFNSSALASPLSSDVSQIGSVSLKSATLAATDGEDLSFISRVEIDANGTGLSQEVLATLPSPPAAGVASVQLQLGPNTDLKPYLQAGGVLTANVQYVNFPATARTVQLTLTIHGSLL
jgi:hypothetical protein